MFSNSTESLNMNISSSQQYSMINISSTRTISSTITQFHTVGNMVNSSEIATPSQSYLTSQMKKSSNQYNNLSSFLNSSHSMSYVTDYPSSKGFLSLSTQTVQNSTLLLLISPSKSWRTQDRSTTIVQTDNLSKSETPSSTKTVDNSTSSSSTGPWQSISSVVIDASMNLTTKLSLMTKTMEYQSTFSSISRMFEISSTLSSKLMDINSTQRIVGPMMNSTKSSQGNLIATNTTDVKSNSLSGQQLYSSSKINLIISSSYANLEKSSLLQNMSTIQALTSYRRNISNSTAQYPSPVGYMSESLSIISIDTTRHYTSNVSPGIHSSSTIKIVNGSSHNILSSLTTTKTTDVPIVSSSADQLQPENSSTWNQDSYITPSPSHSYEHTTASRIFSINTFNISRNTTNTFLSQVSFHNNSIVSTAQITSSYQFKPITYTNNHTYSSTVMELNNISSMFTTSLGERTLNITSSSIYLTSTIVNTQEMKTTQVTNYTRKGVMSSSRNSTYLNTLSYRLQILNSTVSPNVTYRSTSIFNSSDIRPSIVQSSTTQHVDSTEAVNSTRIIIFPTTTIIANSTMSVAKNSSTYLSTVETSNISISPTAVYGFPSVLNTSSYLITSTEIPSNVSSASSVYSFFNTSSSRTKKNTTSTLVLEPKTSSVNLSYIPTLTSSFKQSYYLSSLFTTNQTRMITTSSVSLGLRKSSVNTSYVSQLTLPSTMIKNYSSFSNINQTKTVSTFATSMFTKSSIIFGLKNSSTYKDIQSSSSKNISSIYITGNKTITRTPSLSNMNKTYVKIIIPTLIYSNNASINSSDISSTRNIPTSIVYPTSTVSNTSMIVPFPTSPVLSSQMSTPIFNSSSLRFFPTSSIQNVSKSTVYANKTRLVSNSLKIVHSVNISSTSTMSVTRSTLSILILPSSIVSNTAGTSTNITLNRTVTSSQTTQMKMINSSIPTLKTFKVSSTITKAVNSSSPTPSASLTVFPSTYSDSKNHSIIATKTQESNQKISSSFFTNVTTLASTVSIHLINSNTMKLNTTSLMSIISTKLVTARIISSSKGIQPTTVLFSSPISSTVSIPIPLSKQRIISCNATITNRVYTNQLSNRSSQEYIELAKEVKTSVSC